MLEIVDLQESITRVLVFLSGVVWRGSSGPPKSWSLGVRRVLGAHPGGFREAPHKQNVADGAGQATHIEERAAPPEKRRRRAGLPVSGLRSWLLASIAWHGGMRQA